MNGNGTTNGFGKDFVLNAYSTTSPSYPQKKDLALSMPQIMRYFANNPQDQTLFNTLRAGETIKTSTGVYRHGDILLVVHGKDQPIVRSDQTSGKYIAQYSRDHPQQIFNLEDAISEKTVRKNDCLIRVSGVDFTDLFVERPLSMLLENQYFVALFGDFVSQEAFARQWMGYSDSKTMKRLSMREGEFDLLSEMANKNGTYLNGDIVRITPRGLGLNEHCDQRYKGAYILALEEPKPVEQDDLPPSLASKNTRSTNKLLFEDIARVHGAKH